MSVTKVPKPGPRYCEGNSVESRWDDPTTAWICSDNYAKPVDIGYELPRGLKHHRYKMRMTTYGGDGLIVVHSWDVVPSDHPVQAPYKGTFREPRHRGASSLAGAEERHPSNRIVQGAVGAGAVVAAAAMAGAGWRGRRIMRGRA